MGKHRTIWDDPKEVRVGQRWKSTDPRELPKEGEVLSVHPDEGVVAMKWTPGKFTKIRIERLLTGPYKLLVDPLALDLDEPGETRRSG
jgi:hypothetical protein